MYVEILCSNCSYYAVLLQDAKSKSPGFVPAADILLTGRSKGLQKPAEHLLNLDSPTMSLFP